MVNLVILVYILLIFNDDDMETSAPINKKKMKLKEKDETSGESSDSKGSEKNESMSARKRKV